MASRTEPSWHVRRRRWAGIIERWQKRQRNWACFAGIADWSAREGGSITPDEGKRLAAFCALATGLEDGEFDRCGREMVLSLDRSRGPWRMTRDRLADELRVWRGISRATGAERASPPDHPVEQILGQCWAPRDLCRAWFDRRRLAIPPWLAEDGDGAAAAESRNRTAPPKAADAIGAEQPQSDAGAPPLALKRRPGIRTTEEEKAESDCLAWIRALKKRPENIQTLLSEAQGKFLGLSEAAFRRAWHAAAPEEWKKAGRRSRNHAP